MRVLIANKARNGFLSWAAVEEHQMRVEPRGCVAGAEDEARRLEDHHKVVHLYRSSVWGCVRNAEDENYLDPTKKVRCRVRLTTDVFKVRRVNDLDWNEIKQLCRLCETAGAAYKRQIVTSGLGLPTKLPKRRLFPVTLAVGQSRYSKAHMPAVGDGVGSAVGRPVGKSVG